MNNIVKELEEKLGDVMLVKKNCEDRVCQIEQEMRYLISQKNIARIQGRVANGLDNSTDIDREEMDEKLVQLEKERKRLKKKMRRLDTDEMIEQINKNKN